MIEAQDRHEKSPKKITSTHARCCSSGDSLHALFSKFNGMVGIRDATAEDILIT